MYYFIKSLTICVIHIWSPLVLNQILHYFVHGSKPIDFILGTEMGGLDFCLKNH